MADYSVKRIDDMQAHARGSFKLARAELGVTSFGIQVIDMPPAHRGVPGARPRPRRPGGGLPRDPRRRRDRDRGRAPPARPGHDGARRGGHEAEAVSRATRASAASSSAACLEAPTRCATSPSSGHPTRSRTWPGRARRRPSGSARWPGSRSRFPLGAGRPAGSTPSRSRLSISAVRSVSTSPSRSRRWSRTADELVRGEQRRAGRARCGPVVAGERGRRQPGESRLQRGDLLPQLTRASWGRGLRRPRTSRGRARCARRPRPPAGRTPPARCSR